MTRGTVARRPRRRAGLGLLVLVVISIGLLFVPLASTGVLAASVEPVTSLEDPMLEGNPTCSEVAVGYGGSQTWTGAKIDARPDAGTYDVGGGRSVTITAWDPTTKTFSWTSTFGVDAVFIKAGEGGDDAANTLYVYAPSAASPESLGDTGLTSAGARGVSHVDFCWDAGDPPSASPSPEASIAPSAVPASPGPSASPSSEASVAPAASSEISPSPTGEVLPAVGAADVTPPPTDRGLGVGLPDPSSAGLGLLLLVLAALGSLAVVATHRSRHSS